MKERTPRIDGSGAFVRSSRATYERLELRLLDERLLEDRFAEERFAEERLAVPLFAEDFFADDFFADDFFADDFFADDFLRAEGTFAPLARASLSPIAIACLRLFTLPPLPPRPLRSVPAFRFFIALRTERPAPAPYLRPPDFFAAIVDLRVMRVGPSESRARARAMPRDAHRVVRAMTIFTPRRTTDAARSTP